MLAAVPADYITKLKKEYKRRLFERGKWSYLLGAY
jgi:hypothetical protein